MYDVYASIILFENNSYLMKYSVHAFIILLIENVINVIFCWHSKFTLLLITNKYCVTSKSITMFIISFYEVV